MSAKILLKMTEPLYPEQTTVPELLGECEWCAWKLGKNGALVASTSGLELWMLAFTETKLESSLG